MSKIIQCDGCKATMPLGGKGMHEICIDGDKTYDLCFCCSFALMRDILRLIPKEDIEGEENEEEI